MELNLTNAMPFSFFDYSFKIMSSIAMIFAEWGKA